MSNDNIVIDGFFYIVFQRLLIFFEARSDFDKSRTLVGKLKILKNTRKSIMRTRNTNYFRINGDRLRGAEKVSFALCSF